MSATTLEQEIQQELIDILGPKGVQLDWKAYYDRFDASHGGHPIEYRGRLLWADGWTYSSTDHAGPEWAAPSDKRELRVYQIVYWTRRKGFAKQEMRDKQDELQSLKETQRAKSVPLQVKLLKPSTNDEGLPIMLAEYVDIDFTLLEEKLGYLRQELEYCELKLKEVQ